jgi:quinol monooxygenase YgiN
MAEEVKAEINCLWRDIFRKADKNDDNHITRDEFFDYFGDDYMTDKELNDLFDTIDSNESSSIEVEELIAFFSSGFDAYKDMFKVIEDGHSEINKILQNLNKNYSTLPEKEQFKVRFFLTEYLNQIQLLHKPISTALNKIQKIPAHRLSRSEVLPEKKLFSSKRHRLETNSLQSEISRLSHIVGKLEKSKIYLNFQEQLRVDKSQEPGNVIFSREIHVQEEHVDDFIEATKEYLHATKYEPDCLYTYVKKEQKHCYSLYSVWRSMDSLSAHYLKPHYRTHIKVTIDFLVEPEKINRMTIPNSWVTRSSDH